MRNQQKPAGAGNAFLGTVDLPHDGHGHPRGFDVDGGYTFHYGFKVRSKKPVTGVISNGAICQFISDECYGGDSIDLGWESAIEDFKAEHGREPDDGETDGWEISGEHLIGDWQKDTDGLWEPIAGSAGYSAIVGETYTQVVLSATTERAAMCSPCFPGQADIGSAGPHLAYTLPADCFDEE